MTFLDRTKTMESKDHQNQNNTPSTEPKIPNYVRYLVTRSLFSYIGLGLFFVFFAVAVRIVSLPVESLAEILHHLADILDHATPWDSSPGAHPHE